MDTVTEVRCDEKCPEFYLTVLRAIRMRFHQVCKCCGHACESTWLQAVLLFSTSHRCVYQCQFHSGLCDDWQFISRACQPITHLLLFTREDTLKK